MVWCRYWVIQVDGLVWVIQVNGLVWVLGNTGKWFRVGNTVIEEQTRELINRIFPNIPTGMDYGEEMTCHFLLWCM